MAGSSDQRLWAAVVAARRRLHRAQADFHQHADNRVDVLRAALAERGVDQTAALRYLDEFAQETLALLPELVELAVSDRTHGWACEAIGRLRHEVLIPALEPIIAQHLDRADDYEYQMLSSLLARIQAWDLLHGLMQRALRSGDPEILEVGTDLESDYPFLSALREPPAEPDA